MRIITLTLFLTLFFTLDVSSQNLFKLVLKDTNNNKVGNVVALNGPNTLLANGIALVEIFIPGGRTYVEFSNGLTFQPQGALKVNNGALLLAFTEEDCTGQMYITDFSPVGNVFQNLYNSAVNNLLTDQIVVVAPNDPTDTNSGYALYSVDVDNPVDSPTMSGFDEIIPPTTCSNFNYNSGGNNIKLFPLTLVKDISTFTAPFRVVVKKVNVGN